MIEFSQSLLINLNKKKKMQKKKVERERESQKKNEEKIFNFQTSITLVCI